jgi:hypothetical protein
MTSHEPSMRPAPAILIAVAVLATLSLALRFGTRVSELEPVWDEPLMQPVVAAIVNQGWTAEHMLDYEDTKGPAFFWGYALVAEVLGPSVGVLRIITLAIFVACGVPLGVIAARCGLSAWRVAAVAALWALLPYAAVLGQLFMSEASFLLGALLLVATYLWGEAIPSGRSRAVPVVVYLLLLSLLLHHRPHVVAYAAAIVLAASRRDGIESWPWWVASALAGLSRLPLYLRWDGLVSEAYQGRMGLGLRLDSMTYVAIALLPCTAAVLVLVLTERRYRGRILWVGAGLVVGLVLGIAAVPDLSLVVDDGRARYMGMVATVLRPVAHTAIFSAGLAGLAAVGGAGLAAIAIVALEKPPDRLPRLVVALACMLLLMGWILYGLTRGAVFDRYMLPFIALMPFVWILRLPPWLLAVQAVGLVGLMGRLAWTWLI